VVVQQLLEWADIYARDKYRRTALQYAARWGHKMVVRLLLDGGADVDAKTRMMKRRCMRRLKMDMRWWCNCFRRTGPMSMQEISMIERHCMGI
jgi:hypothetical protein